MKNLKFNKIILLLIGLVVFNSCVEDDDFAIPDTSIIEPVLDGQQVSIASIAGALAQEQGNNSVDYSNDDDLVSFDFGGPNQYLTGYVVSSDEGGNFFEELIIQDAPENPTTGIKVLVDVNPLFTRYEVGRKVFVKLNGLVVGISNGVLAIGPQDGDRVGQIPGASEEDFILRSAEVATIVPLPLSIADFTEDRTNLMIELQDVQFNRGQVLGDNPLSFASEGSDQFDGERLLESCSSATTAIFSTSTFSDFKALTLPSGRGNMTAILTRNFFGDTFNIAINSPEDINFSSSDRCDPDFLECSGTSGGGSAIFFEDFETFSSFTAEGWTNVNINGGGTEWTEGGFGGNDYAQITGFNSDEDPIEVFLVTPPIDLDTTTGEELSFDVQTNFDNGTILSVLVSTDFTGDPTTATWQPLDAVIPSGPANGFGTFQSVGPINVSCLDGTVHFAFFYEGADPGATTRYHVDNVEVTGN
ncbi:DUF5689 domain-containing protein [Winogradskyella immobilis]|uniref:Choice-of-anchor J domain-containing protein n=1 Tax=Winogradskyella immobilis TaxID=2816852 RepID=A0ABS8EJA0_9FLAO|nr:DUF5689 domain-containing protein [Winogradskyella immobilis]MCC1483289.1 choice-of-anchor J domain-containing protein [Winogradskyella immobilis]MCG0015383.1 DUF5689 domain-containing protein [Winogradskyella immobilis]